MNVLQAKKNSNTWIEVFASLKTLKKHEFIFSQNDWNVLQSKKAQKHELNFFASLKKLKRHGFNLLQASKVHESSFLQLLKAINWIFESLKNLKKHEFDFLQA